MIRPLRRRHEQLIAGVALVVVPVFVVALMVRPDAPILPAPPAPRTSDWTELVEDGSLRALIESRDTREWLHLARATAFVAPDALVYWSPEVPGADEPIPSDAVLLGALGDSGNHTYDLPARDSAGNLLVYSLAHESLVASASIPGIRRIGEGR